MFLIDCPNCGPRDGSEFHSQGEVHPALPWNEQLSPESWAAYLYYWDNPRGMTTEWCFHQTGCGEWFIVERDTSSNRVARTFYPEDRNE